MAERRPVVAIPPSYNRNEDLETDSTKSYLNYLKENGAECVMTTAGTSQFNLLSTEEVHTLNEAVSSFEGQKILGVPALSLKHTIDFIKRASESYLDENSKLMVLYPDRYYYDDVLENFEEYVGDRFAGHENFLSSLKEFVHSFSAVVKNLDSSKLCDVTNNYITSLLYI